MEKIITVNENGKLVDFVFPDSLEEKCADGFGLSMVGFPNTKLTFIQNRLANEGEKETKEIVASITMPTIAILELAELIKKSMLDNEAMLRQHVEKILSLSKN